jgi:hypothetical protein
LRSKIIPANGGIELYTGMKKYMEFYKTKRPHQSLEYITPKQDFEAMKKAA